MVIAGDELHRFLIHNHDSSHAASVDRTVAAMGLTVLRTPMRSPHANAFCEKVIGTIRRECLDWMIPLNEGHLRRVLQEWVGHRTGVERPSIRESHRVVAAPILGGLHHEYRLEPRAA
jgi:hypothetical protein